MKDFSSETQILVRLLRAVRSWTQEELAVASGLDLSSVHRYETGQTEASKEAGERMARAVGLSPAFLWGRLEPFLADLLAEATGKAVPSRAGVEAQAQEVGRRVGAIAEQEARGFFSGLKPPA